MISFAHGDVYSVRVQIGYRVAVDFVVRARRTCLENRWYICAFGYKISRMWCYIYTYASQLLD